MLPAVWIYVSVLEIIQTIAYSIAIDHCLVFGIVFFHCTQDRDGLSTSFRVNHSGRVSVISSYVTVFAHTFR